MSLEDVLKAKEEDRSIPWRKCTDNELREYYTLFHRGKSRWEVGTDDYGFYQALTRRKITNKILPESKLKDWTSMKLKDLQNYYKKYHNWKSRYEVQKNDQGFYHTLAKRKLVDRVLPKSKCRNWGDFSIKDFREYYDKNYQGKGRKEVYKDDTGFYAALLTRKLVDRILPKSKCRNWEGLSIKDIREYYSRNHKGKSRGEVYQYDSGFYKILHKRKLLDKVIPEKKAPFLYRFNRKKVYFDSCPERITGIMLNKYFNYQPKEGKNLHVRTNGSKRHSIDFLIEDKLLEYHPIGRGEIREGLTLKQAGESKKDHITNPEYKNYGFYHIWEIGQLYNVMMNGMNKYVLPEFKNITKEQFDKDVSMAYKQTVRYDARQQEATA